MDAWERKLGDEAPERLRGRKVRAILTEKELLFEFDMPEDPTNQELAYMKWFAGEFVEKAGLDLAKLGEPHKVLETKNGQDSVATVDGETGKAG